MLDPLSLLPERDGGEPLYREGFTEITTSKELRAFLANRTETDALAELVEGDRLGMKRRTKEWLQSRCYLLDRRRLILDSLAKIVAAGPTLEESDALGVWIDQRIENAARVLLEVDAQEARQRRPLEEPFEPRLLFLMGTLAFRGDEVRRAIVAANELRSGERHVFYNCFVIGCGFERYEEQEGIKAEHARSLLIRAVDKLSAAVGDV